MPIPSNTMLSVGTRVHIDVDDKEWGRVATDAIVTEVPKSARCKVLVNALSIRANILVSRRDMALTT